MLEAKIDVKVEYAFDVTGKDAKICVFEMISKADDYGGELLEQKPTGTGEYVRFEFLSIELMKRWFTAIRGLQNILDAKINAKVEYAFNIIGNDAKTCVVEMINKANHYGGKLLEQKPTKIGEYARFEFPTTELINCWFTAVKVLQK